MTCNYINYMIYELFERDTLMELNPEVLKTEHNSIKDIINSLLVNYITDDLCMNNDTIKEFKYTSYYKNDKMKYMLILVMIYIKNYRFYENEIFIEKEDEKTYVINIKKICEWKKQIDKKVIERMKEQCKNGYCFCNKTKKNINDESNFNDYSWTIIAYEISNKNIYRDYSNKSIPSQNLHVDSKQETPREISDFDTMFNIKKYYRKDICPFAHKFILDKKLMLIKYKNIKKIIDDIPLEPDNALTFILILFNKMLIHKNSALMNSFDMENVIYNIIIFIHHIFKFNFMTGKSPKDSTELLNYMFIINNSISEHLLDKCESECICEYTDDIKEKIRKQNAFKSYILKENKIEYF